MKLVRPKLTLTCLYTIESHTLGLTATYNIPAEIFVIVTKLNNS